jgi:hypothetical protein
MLSGWSSGYVTEYSMDMAVLLVVCKRGRLSFRELVDMVQFVRRFVVGDVPSRANGVLGLPTDSVGTYGYTYGRDSRSRSIENPRYFPEF